MARAKKAAASSARSNHALEVVRERLGNNAVVRITDGFSSAPLEVIPLGVDAVDKHVCGIGGLPVGRIVEVFGDEGSGKTSLALAACAGVQKLGGSVLFVDTEHALLPARLRTFDIDDGEFLYSQPDTLEETYQVLREYVLNLKKAEGPHLVVWDSIAATPPVAEMQDGESPMGARARIIGQAMRVLTGAAAKRRCCVLLVNQTRIKIGGGYGNNTTTPGGDGPKFHSSLRLQLWASTQMKNGKTTYGRCATVKAVKNKLAHPFKKAKVLIDFNDGFANAWSTLELAKVLGVISKRARGKDALKEAEAALDAIQWGATGLTGSMATEGDDEEQKEEGAEE